MTSTETHQIPTGLQAAFVLRYGWCSYHNIRHDKHFTYLFVGQYFSISVVFTLSWQSTLNLHKFWIKFESYTVLSPFLVFITPKTILHNFLPQQPFCKGRPKRWRNRIPRRRRCKCSRCKGSSWGRLPLSVARCTPRFVSWSGPSCDLSDEREISSIEANGWKIMMNGRERGRTVVKVHQYSPFSVFQHFKFRPRSRSL